VNASRADQVGTPGSNDPTLRARVVLVSSDPVFAALCKRALEEGPSVQLVVAVSTAELLETARQVAPDFLVLDVDGEDVVALKTLVAKVMLVSDAPVVLVSAYLAPGSPGLGALLQSIAARFVQKPQGPSSLSLADRDGPPFVAALQAAFAAHEGEDLAAENLDAGWDGEDLQAAAAGGQGGAAHD
jgi:chemotaxis response regulator CheB